MKELSLFTGAGGGVLGTKLLGWRHIGYVEWDKYCQKVIAQRIKDGILDESPIFGDIRTFNAEYAQGYNGLVDVVSAGFPCQPFSVAGKRAGADDERNMWPATIECIRLVRPRFCLLENVPGLLRSGYFGTILRDLAESGYDCRWCMLSAAEVGAPHLRERIWIIADDRSQRTQRVSSCSVQGECGIPWSENGRRLTDWRKRSTLYTPKLCRSGDGVANRVDRVKALGNGQVPAVVRAAWSLLTTQASEKGGE